MTGVLGCIRLRNAARVLLHDRWSGMHRSRMRPGCFFMTGVLGCIGLRNAARVLLHDLWSGIHWRASMEWECAQGACFFMVVWDVSDCMTVGFVGRVSRECAHGAAS